MPFIKNLTVHALLGGALAFLAPGCATHAAPAQGVTAENAAAQTGTAQGATEKPTVDLSGAMPVDLINEPTTFARRVVEAMKKQRDGAEKSKQDDLIAKGILPPPPSPAQRRAQFVRFAQSSEEGGFYDSLIKEAREQQQNYPDDANGPFYEGRGLFYNGDYAGAIAAWEKAVALDASFKTKVAVQLAQARAIQKRWGAQAKLELVESDLTRELAPIRKRAAADFAAKKYDALEIQVAALTQSQQMTASGRWYLTACFEGFTLPANGRTDETAWSELQKRVEAWRAAKPDSWLPRVALAQVLIHRAWRARGSSWAKDVSPEAYQQMGQYMKQMGEILDEGGDLKKQIELSPLFSGVFNDWALLSGLDSATYDQLSDAVIGKFPNYWESYRSAAFRLLPRWYGEPGEWEDYAEAAANRVGKTRGAAQGDRLYALMVSEIAQKLRKDNIWETSSADWPRTKRGIEAILSQHPDSLGAKTALFEFAVQARDWATARSALKLLNGQVSRGYYEDNPRAFALRRIEVLAAP